MFDSSKAFSGFSVDDLDKAREFYGDTLGLEVTTEPMGLLSVKIGAGTVMVYAKGEGHSPATFTVLNFPVDDIGAAVDALVGKGLQMLRYDGFDQDEKGITRGDEGPAIAWFTDPAGNILSVLEE